MCLFLVIFCYLILNEVGAAVKLPANETIPGVIVFGDSIVDTGNNNYIETIIKVNYPPYGKDFMGGKPTGRFSDGKVPSDLLVEELGIKELSPPYLDPTLPMEELITGVNFASGGVGYDPLTSQLVNVVSLLDQIELFKEYIMKLKGGVGEERTNTILSNSLYIVVAGSNDITNTFFNGPFRRPHYTVDSYTNLMLDSASTFLQQIYRLGARRIGVFGIPPIGCVPLQRTLTGGVERKCAEKYNEAAQLFNTKLSAELNSLNSNLPQARLVYIDVYNLPLDLINKPRKYGFEIADKGCCGTGIGEVAFLCKSTCTDASKYIFWDGFHLTEKAYRLLVNQVLINRINSFFFCPNSSC